jgi:hypothetical protein
LTSGIPNYGGTDGLYRLPQVVSATQTASVFNGIAPDGVTVSNMLGNLSINQLSGPTAMSVSVQNAPAGTFSARSLGQATISLNLATAQRGLYETSMNENVVGDYSYGSTVDVGRPITSIDNNEGFAGFGYDPVSSNIVGNGDASLGATGWEFRLGDNGGWESEQLDPTPNGFRLFPAFSQSVSIRQFLQLPTADAPMILAFTGQLDSGGNPASVEVQVDLNGEVVDDVFVNSASPQTFSTEITDPTLQNLNNAVLMFYLPDRDNDLAEIDLDNISLTAVPEPACSASALLLGGIFFTRPRNRHG